MPLDTSDIPGGVPTDKEPPDSAQSGKQDDPDGTSTPADTDESKKLP